MNRVYITPTYSGPDRADGGIRRVTEAQSAHLPAFGWQVVDTPDAADLIAGHGTMYAERGGVPLVAHCHGAMWSEYDFGDWGDKINRQVAELLIRADAITAPSQWVARAMTRGLLRTPEVVYHGVDADAWEHSEPSLGYVLWNKARADWVADPRDMNDVAALLPDVPFVSTFGQPAGNVHVCGAAPYDLMRPLVQRAGCYLATARETFGIGTLEALAAGVPVAGWDYGGQAEIVIPGETGYLAPWGDYDALAACVRRCLAERTRMAPLCVEDARTRWTWPAAIERYAALYDRVLTDARAARPKVSVIVTCYNLARYLPDAMDSVRAQTMDDWECLIVDDGSTDETEAIGRTYVSASVRYLKTPRNLGLSAARNYGWQQSRGRYVLFLDADDMLAPDALATLSHALDHDRGIHIAYGRMDVVNDTGDERRRNPWPSGAFSWEGQVAHLNQLPYAALMRRAVLAQSGGYRVRDWRAEDASFWSRVTSFGFRAARVTDSPTLIYRLRGDSKSRGEPGDGDWTAWLPWRLAGDAPSGLRAMETGQRPNPAITPWGAQGDAPAPLTFWPVPHHQNPLISVIIPVGPGHERYLIDALDSVQAQTLPDWECIVVNDTGAPLDTRAHPWARVWEVNRLDGDAVVRMGPGGARNWGLRHATAPLCLFLDADDILHPKALEAMARVYAETGHYAYCDTAELEDESRIDASEVITHAAADYDARRMFRQLYHAVTALIETEHARVVGGFDEQLPIFEDWDFFAKLAARGVCGQRIAFPLLIYRRAENRRTRGGIEARAANEPRGSAPRYTPMGEAVVAAIIDRYAAYDTGEEPIMGCCGGNTAVQAHAQDALAALLPHEWVLSAPAGEETHARASVRNAAGVVRMEFIGVQEGAQTYAGRVSGLAYRAGREMSARFIDADPRDVEHLLSLGDGSGPLFRVVPRPAPVEAPEAPHDGASAERRRGRPRRAA